jgi:hypothetical protein
MLAEWDIYEITLATNAPPRFHRISKQVAPQAIALGWNPP